MILVIQASWLVSYLGLWHASYSYRYWRCPLNHRMINFPFNCCAFSLLDRVNDLYWNSFLSKWAVVICHLYHSFFVPFSTAPKSCFKAVNKFIVHKYFSASSIVWKSYIRFLVRLCIHNINFWSEKFVLFARKIINVWGRFQKCDPRSFWCSGECIFTSVT